MSSLQIVGISILIVTPIAVVVCLWLATVLLLAIAEHEILAFLLWFGGLMATAILLIVFGG